MKNARLPHVVALGLALSLQMAPAKAAEIKVWAARALVTVLAEVGPEFERTSGHRIVASSGLASEFVSRAHAGEPFDLMITGQPQLDRLIKEGRITAASRVAVARSGIGVEVRAGASKPDVGSVEAFKRALLDAKSIAYLKDVGSGVHVHRVIEGLGIADTIRGKVTRTESDIVSELVARGEAELGMVVITQIMTTPGVQLAGPLPPELQSYVTFTAGISAAAPAPGAATLLLKSLMTPSTVAVIRAQGMEPVPGAATPGR
jgi:molybdate transport system substrate-binding protein